MKLGLKSPWFMNAGDPISKEFENIKDWFNAHDQGSKKWTRFNSLGSFSTGFRSAAATATLSDTDSVLMADSTAAGFTVNLPSAVGIPGRSYTVKDWKGQSAANNITLDGNGAQTIDGAATLVIATNYRSVTVVSDGANWATI